MPPFAPRLHALAGKGAWAECMRLCRFARDPAVWAALAGIALKERELSTAEAAFAAIQAADRVEFVQHLRQIPTGEAGRSLQLRASSRKTSAARVCAQRPLHVVCHASFLRSGGPVLPPRAEEGRSAELAAFAGEFEAGEDLLLRAGLIYRALDLNMALVRGRRMQRRPQRAHLSPLRTTRAVAPGCSSAGRARWSWRSSTRRTWTRCYCGASSTSRPRASRRRTGSSCSSRGRCGGAQARPRPRWDCTFASLQSAAWLFRTPRRLGAGPARPGGHRQQGAAGDRGGGRTGGSETIPAARSRRRVDIAIVSATGVTCLNVTCQSEPLNPLGVTPARPPARCGMTVTIACERPCYRRFPVASCTLLWVLRISCVRWTSSASPIVASLA